MREGGDDIGFRVAQELGNFDNRDNIKMKVNKGEGKGRRKGQVSGKGRVRVSIEAMKVRGSSVRALPGSILAILALTFSFSPFEAMTSM